MKGSKTLYTLYDAVSKCYMQNEISRQFCCVNPSGMFFDFSRAYEVRRQIKEHHKKVRIDSDIRIIKSITNWDEIVGV